MSAEPIHMEPIPGPDETARQAAERLLAAVDRPSFANLIAMIAEAQVALGRSVLTADVAEGHANLADVRIANAILTTAARHARLLAGQRA